MHEVGRRYKHDDDAVNLAPKQQQQQLLRLHLQMEEKRHKQAAALGNQ